MGIGERKGNWGVRVQTCVE